MNKTTHGQKRWRRPTNYRFAAEEALTPIVLAGMLCMWGSWTPIVVERPTLWSHSVTHAPVPKHNLLWGPPMARRLDMRRPRCGSYPFRCRAGGLEQMALRTTRTAGSLPTPMKKGRPSSWPTASRRSHLELIEFLRLIEAAAGR